MGKRSPSPKGFSLLELLITLAVALILLAVGIPGFRGTLNSNQRTTEINELITSLHLARSEALKRGNDVSVCRKKDGSSTDCATDPCNTATHANCWENGWIVFADDDSSGTRGTRDSNEEMIRVFEFDDARHNWRSTNYANAITYIATGAVAQAGLFSYCIDWNGDGDFSDSVDATNWRAVIVNRTGRPRLSVDDDDPKNRVHDDGSGNDLTCP